MNRIIFLLLVIFPAISVFATDSFTTDHPGPMRIATTGRIVKIDPEARTIVVRTSAGLSTRNPAPTEKHVWQHVGFKMPCILIPGGIAIPWRKTGKEPQTDSSLPSLDEYTVVTTEDTVFQDGANPIEFEDFKTGETISIHGMLVGSILTASRLAKWN